jgi:subtilisin family serine protease
MGCKKKSLLIKGPGQDLFYENVVRIWREVGIIPIFAAGNAGPSCGTSGSPGDYDNAIGIGATNQNDELSSFSSRGPTYKGTVKPDFSAPGVKILSSFTDSNSSYKRLSGTSMATPHVAGVVALMMSAHKKKYERMNVDDQIVLKPYKKMSYDEIYDILIRSSISDNPEPIDGGGYTRYPRRKVEICGRLNYTNVPNNFYGYGRIDAFRAVHMTVSQ